PRLIATASTARDRCLGAGATAAGSRSGSGAHPPDDARWREAVLETPLGVGHVVGFQGVEEKVRAGGLVGNVELDRLVVRGEVELDMAGACRRCRVRHYLPRGWKGWMGPPSVRGPRAALPHPARPDGQRPSPRSPSPP